MIFSNRYLCLEYIPYLKSSAEKEAYAASILKFQFGSIEKAEGFITDYKLNDKESVYYCADIDRLKEKTKNTRDCSLYIKGILPDAALCKKMCESCVLCSKTWKLEEEFEWRYVNALYHSGLHMDVNSINKNLKAAQFFIYGASTDKPIFFSIKLAQKMDELIRNNYQNLKKDYNADLKFLQQKISEPYEKRGKNLAAQIRKDIYIRIKAILDMKVSLEDAEYAVTILTENRRTVPTRKSLADSMQNNLMDIKLSEEVTSKDNVVVETPAKADEKSEAPVIETNEESRSEHEDNILASQIDLLESIGVDIKPNENTEPDETNDIGDKENDAERDASEGGKKETNQEVKEPTQAKEEVGAFTFQMTDNGLVLNSKDEIMPFIRLRSHADISALFDWLYDCRMVSCEAVILDGDPGLFIYGNINFDMPVFVNWKLLSNQETALLLNSNKYVALTANYELLMQYARRKGLETEGNCASITAAYHALYEDAAIYPFSRLLSENSLYLEKDTAITFLEIFENYFRIYSHLKNVILDKKVLRHYKTNKFYEYALSSADEMEHITKGIGRNLTRADYYTSEFRYQPWFKLKCKGTVFQLYIKDAERLNELKHFKLTLIRNIFKREPFENIRWSILYITDSDLYLFSKQTNKDVVNHIKERIGVAVADTCKAYKLEPLTFIVNVVK